MLNPAPQSYVEEAMLNTLRFLIIGVLIATACGCDGPQSALAPASDNAANIAHLFWWMTGVGFLIWVIVVGLAVYAIQVNPNRHSVKLSVQFIIGGGVVAPTIILTILLVFGLGMLPAQLRPSPPGSLAIEVDGVQWWWRVKYRLPEYRDETTEGGLHTVELANEIRLPVNQPVDLFLESEDVIHSFWAPSLGGKVDMIPGRGTRLSLRPNRTGVFRGQCAEYCGAAHTWMCFYVVVMEEDEFQQWLQLQQEPAKTPADPLPSRGREVFLQSGCGACHTIRGESAAGVIGPDLTHVGSRVSLAAGTITADNHEMNEDDFLRWIKSPNQSKPAVHMPHYSMLEESDLKALAAYLSSLQ